jgi:membrane protease YdiL (CAAX protease family)
MTGSWAPPPGTGGPPQVPGVPPQVPGVPPQGAPGPWAPPRQASAPPGPAPGSYGPAPVAYAPPGPLRWSRQPHAEPTPYLHLLRTRTHRWWKSLLGLLLIAVLWLGAQLVVGIVIGIQVLVTGGSADDFTRLLEGVSPGILLLTNLALAAAIPLTGVAVLVCHQERMGWLCSVLGRIRWRLLLGCTGFAVVLMAVSVGVGIALPESAGGGLPELNPPGGTELAALIAVFALTTPLQAAGEEFLFRGYLAQAIASWIPPRVAALLVTAPITALLFALAHGVQDPWLFADRFGFGIAASVLVWLTGGLEASIALHTVNNLVAFGLSTLTGTLADAVNVNEAPASGVILDLAGLTVFTLGVWLWTVRRPVRTLTDALAGGPFWSPR